MEQYIKLCLLGFLATLSYFISRYPIISLYAESLNAGPEMIGLIVSASSITGIFFKVQMGVLSDYLGRRRLLIISMLFFSITPFLYLYCKDPKTLFFIRVIHGFATAIFAPTISSVISHLSNANNRGKLFSSYSSLNTIGEMTGPIICGWLLFWSGFTLPFIISGIIGIASFYLSLTLPYEKNSKSNKEIELKTLFKKVFSNKIILLISLVECIQFLVGGAFEGFLPIYAKNHINLSVWQTGIIFGVFYTCIIFFKPIWGTLSDIFGRKLQISLGLVIGGVSFMLIPLSHTFLVILLLISLYGISVSIVTSATSPYITDLSNKENYGAAHGIFGTITDIGHASGSILAGILISHFDYDSMFITLGCVLLVFGIIFRLVLEFANYQKSNII